MPLQLIRKDITKMHVDAIVNPTNEEMIGYSGVDLAIHKVAGPRLDAACAKLTPLALGQAKITKGYDLDASYIIHTAGPVWHGGQEDEHEILRSCYLESLQLALRYDCESIAFPLISSGEYGFPKDQVLKYALQVLTEFLLDHEMMIYLCVFDRSSYEFSRKLFTEILDFIDESESCAPQKDFVTGTKNFCRPQISSLQEERCAIDDFSSEKQAAPSPRAKKLRAATATGKKATSSLQEYMKSMDKSFAHKLFDWIDRRGMTDVECYKKANVDKKTFSKIKCNPNTYRPSKQTAVAFAIALRLNLEETQDLLASAGLTLSRSLLFDKIILYFLQKEIYDIFEINEALFEFDQVLLGC